MTETTTTEPDAPVGEEEAPEVKVKEVETEFFYPQHTDPNRLVPGGQGVYLDDVQRMEAEQVRAKGEGREPDYENAPAIAGTPLHTAAGLFPGGLMPKNLKPDAVLTVHVGEPEPDDEVKKAKDATLQAIESAQKALEQVQVSARSVPANDSASKPAEAEAGGETADEAAEAAAKQAEETQAASAALAAATVGGDTGYTPSAESEEPAASEEPEPEPEQPSGGTTYTSGP